MIAQQLAAAPLFEGLREDWLAALAECGTELVAPAGEMLFREGDPADSFVLVVEGAIALELHAPAGPLVIATLHEHEVVGWSWLFEPRRWQFDCRTTEDTRMVSFDAARVRGLFESDPQLGYELISRFAACIVERLQATRVQLIDVYGRSATGA